MKKYLLNTTGALLLLCILLITSCGGGEGAAEAEAGNTDPKVEPQAMAFHAWCSEHFFIWPQGRILVMFNNDFSLLFNSWHMAAGTWHSFECCAGKPFDLPLFEMSGLFIIIWVFIIVAVKAGINSCFIAIKAVTGMTAFTAEFSMSHFRFHCQSCLSGCHGT